MLSSCLHIDICSNLGLYIWLYFPSLCILTSASFQFCIFNFAFLVSANWHLQYFSSAFYFACFVSGYWHLQSFISVCFSLPPLSLHIDICNISIPYIWLCFPCLCILIYAVIQFCIFDFTFLVSTYSDLYYFNSLYVTLPSLSLQIDICSISLLHFTLLASSLDIDICSLSVLYVLVCLLRLCMLTSSAFQFRTFDFAFLVYAYWHLQ